MPEIQLIEGDARKLDAVPDNSVHCAITSPPYFGLRKYAADENDQIGLEAVPDCFGWVTGNECGHCFVCHMVQVGREIRRVLHPSGTFWLNLGDSYNGSGGAGGDYNEGGFRAGQPRYAGRKVSGLKPKDLIGIPWLTALALRADGWYFRSDVIWAKKNAPPESPRDRPHKGHEYMFLFAKNEHYFYDEHGYRVPAMAESTRSLRTVWEIASAPYKGAHYAPFPPKLVEPCVRLGTSEHGACPKCLAPWERIVERKFHGEEYNLKEAQAQRTKMEGVISGGFDHVTLGLTEYVEYKTVGWQPTCTCNAGDPIPCTVLDPFCGTGTTLLVARGLGRNAIGNDLSGEYLQRDAMVRLGMALPAEEITMTNPETPLFSLLGENS